MSVVPLNNLTQTFGIAEGKLASVRDFLKLSSLSYRLEVIFDSSCRVMLIQAYPNAASLVFRHTAVRLIIEIKWAGRD